MKLLIGCSALGLWLGGAPGLCCGAALALVLDDVRGAL
jgi:hypothetical protein